MIDQYNDDGTGWAQFSDDEVMRYHLARAVSDKARDTGMLLRVIADGVERAQPRDARPLAFPGWDITTFLLCNPSTANAFKPDPTVEGPGITFGKGSRRKPGGVIELPYLDGVQYAKMPVVSCP